MLINRVLNIGASLAIALVVMLIFHGEFRAALQDRSKRPTTQAASQARIGGV